RVGQQGDPGGVDVVEQRLAVSPRQVHAAHRDRDHRGAGRLDRATHDVEIRVLPRADDQTRRIASSRDGEGPGPHGRHPPPTNCTNSTRSPSRRVLRPKSPRRRTSPFSSTATLPGDRPTDSRRASTVMSGVSSRPSPLRMMVTRPVHPAALRAGFLITCLISALSFPEEAWMISAAVPSSRTGRGQESDTCPASSVAPSTSVFGLSTVLISFTLTFAPATP